MRSYLHIIAVTVLGLSLAGCLKIDEGSVFAPQPVEVYADTADELGLDGQERLTQPTKEQLVNARGYASHLPAQIKNGFLGQGEDRVAWTTVSSLSSELVADKRPLIVHCFGNTSDRRRHGVNAAVKVFPWGDAYLFDYPGYGDSGGEATADTMYDMSRKVVDHIDQLAKDRPLILWGHSLGGFVCSEIASNSREADLVVLEATAQNVKEVADAWKPWYLPFVRVDIKDSLKDYDNARALAYFKGPVLILGAEKDEKLPIKLAKSLYKSLKRRGVNVKFLEFNGAEHSNIPDQFDFQTRLDPYLKNVSDLKQD